MVWWTVVADGRYKNGAGRYISQLCVVCVESPSVVEDEAKAMDGRGLEYLCLCSKRKMSAEAIV